MLQWAREFSQNDLILDGELTVGDSSASDHTSVSGLVNSSMKTGKPIVTKGLVFNMFDTMDLQDFSQQICQRAYTIRYTKVEELHNFICYKLKAEYQDVETINLIKVANTVELRTHAEIEELYKVVVAKGYEGLILKRCDHLYTFKRNTTWIKLKEIKSADLKCTGVEEGTGKYEKAIGALVCEGIVEGKIFSKAQVEALGDLPSKDQLRSQFMATLLAPK